MIDTLVGESEKILSLDNCPEGLLVLCDNPSGSVYPSVCFVPPRASVLTNSNVGAFYLLYLGRRGWEIIMGAGEGIDVVDKNSLPPRLLGIVHLVEGKRTYLEALTEVLLTYPALPNVCYVGESKADDEHDIWLLTRVLGRGKTVVQNVPPFSVSSNAIAMNVIAQSSVGECQIKWISGLRRRDVTNILLRLPSWTIVEHIHLETNRRPFLDFYALLGAS